LRGTWVRKAGKRGGNGWGTQGGKAKSYHPGGDGNAPKRKRVLGALKGGGPRKSKKKRSGEKKKSCLSQSTV